MPSAPQQFVPVRYSQTSLGAGANAQGQPFPGGLDLTTPSLRLSPGALRDCLNFEVAQFGGYARVQGYERVDGRTSPSSATITVVQVGGFANLPYVGQVITQDTTGATGTVVAVVTAPVPYLVLTMVVGAFDTTHALTTGTAPVGRWLVNDLGVDLTNDAGNRLTTP